MIKKLLQRKYLIIIIPAILLVALLIAALPGAIYREHRYRNAVNLLNSGDLASSQSAFSEIPAYRDSEQMLQQEIPYLRACRLYEAALAGDTSYLEDAGYSASDVNSSTTAPMLLYRAAESVFRSLEDYKDSRQLADDCTSGVEKELQILRERQEAETLRLKQGTYDDALSLLENKAYARAASVFQSLDTFSDSADKVLEARYRKAVSIFRFLSAYDVSRIYASISNDLDQPSIFSLPSDEALRLGSGCLEELRAACGEDPVDIRLEDEPESQLIPLKDALTLQFQALDGYADSASFPALIEENTDYTRDFFMLCSTGDLNAAQSWLKAYQGNFPDRERWNEYLELYLPYCANWDVYLGDAGLLPYTVGQSFQAMSISSKVMLNRESAILRLGFGDGNSFTFDLPSKLGETLFINDELDTGYYMGALNNSHFVYMRYDGNWELISSCDFIRG